MPPAKRSNDGKDPRAGGRYVWHKLRNTGVDYTMILRERRQWLLNQDLAKSETLLCEWFALVQELDAVTRVSDEWTSCCATLPAPAAAVAHTPLRGWPRVAPSPGWVHCPRYDSKTNRPRHAQHPFSTTAVP